MSRSLVELKEALKKEQDVPRIMALLKEIDLCVDQECVTRESFANSKVGGVVKKLSDNSSMDSAVRTRASDLMKKWRARFTATTPSIKEEEEVVVVETPPSEIKRLRVESEADEDRACDRFTVNQQRIFSKLHELFSNDDEFTAGEIRCKVTQLVYALELCTPDEFHDKYKLLKTQLPKNSELRKKVLEGGVEVGELMGMSNEAMLCPEDREVLDKSLFVHREAKRSDWADANRKTILKNAGVAQQEGLFTCNRCKSTNTSYYEKQTRGADEPMTVFIQCLNCRNRWRQN